MARPHLAASALALALSACAGADVCRTLRDTPAEAASRADSARLRRVYDAVRAPYERFWGWPTSFRVVPSDLAIGERRVGAQAFTCGGAGEPAVFAGSALAATLAAPAGRSDDLVAFVLAHELGHRVNDYGPDGARRGFDERTRAIAAEGLSEADRYDAVEALADKRAAFLVALAGYSPSALAREEVVDRFLDEEFRVQRFRRAPRRAQLLAALSRFEDYEWLYQLGTGLTVAGAFETARPLLDWADLAAAGRDVPVPELRVARALERIAEAAPAAMRRYPALAARRCEPVVPGASALVDPVRLVARGAAPAPEALLREALDLLDDAGRRGASPLVVAAARGCALAYLGDLDGAGRETARALALAAASPPPVGAALRRNLALLDDLRAPPAAVAPPAPAPAAGAPACGDARFPDLAAILATARDARDACPAGFVEVRRLEAPVRAGWAAQCAHDETIRLDLVRAAPAPVAAAIELTGPALPPLAAWRCRCTVRPQGVSDLGDEVFQADCRGARAGVGPPFAAALFSGPSGLRRALVVPGDP